MKIKNSDIEAIRKYNSVQVLNTLRQTGQRLSRPNVADILGLSKVTISNILRDLTKEGLTIEAGVGIPDSRGGRKPQLVALDQEKMRVFGALSGSDSVELILSDITGRELMRLRSDPKGHRDRQQLIVDMVTDMLAATNTPKESIRGLVVVMDDEDGRIRSCDYHGSPEDSTPQPPLRDELSRMLGGMSVWLADHTRARAFAEAWFNHGPKTPVNFFYLNLGLKLDGVSTRRNLLDNDPCKLGSCFMSALPYDQRDGEVLTVERAVGGRTLLDRAARAWGRDLSLEGLKALADEGEKEARLIFDEYGHDLGCALSVAVHTTSLTNIVLGGLVAPAWPYFKEAMRRGLDLHLEPELRGQVEVRPLRHDLRNGLMGALAMALDRYVYHTEILYSHTSPLEKK